MLQRIQTLFLLIAGSSLFGLFALPFGTSNAQFGVVYDNQSLDLHDHTALLVGTIVTGVIAILAIFLFNNRNLQAKLALLTAVLCIGLLGIAYWIYNSSMPTDNSATTQLGFGFVLPIVALIFSILASVYIKKDTKLVQSMDRLR